MQNYSENIEFFTRKLAGELLDEEIQSFNEWLAASPHNADEFAEFEKIWNGIDTIKQTKQFNTDAAWTRFSHDIRTVKKSKQAFKPFLVAAAIVGILFMSWFSYKLFITKSIEQITTTTAMHNMQEVVLPDNSIITLHQNSKVTYAKTFDSERRIIMQGKAFFEVTPDAHKPFVVEIENVRVRVLGTSFFISHDTIKNSVLVVVKTGKVAVFVHGTNDTVYVTAGDRVEVDNGLTLSKTINEEKNYISWKTKVFEYQDVPLNQIITEINAAYFTNIKIVGNELQSCRISVKFTNKSIDEIIEILQVTLDIRVQKNQNEIVISGNGC